MQKRWLRLLPLALFAASLTLAGCGGGAAEKAAKDAVMTEEQQQNYESEYDKQMSEGGN